MIRRLREWWQHGRFGRHVAGPDHRFHSEFCKQDVHTQFGLTYASYLTWPRSLMLEMPARWQHEFARLWSELNDEFRAPLDGEYQVLLRDSHGRFTSDLLNNYRYPNRRAIERARDVYGRQDVLRLD